MAGTVRAQVRYLNSEWKNWRDRNERPRICSKATRHANTTLYDVEIADARPLQERGELDLDSTGFVLAPLHSAVTDFRDENEVEETYYGEVQALLRRLTGASHIFSMGHQIRNENPKTFLSAYARYVHCDYRPDRWQAMARDLLSRLKSPLLDEMERWDFAWYNVWQLIERDNVRNYLTVLDASSLDPDSVVEYYVTEGNQGIASLPLHSSAHLLYYFSGLTTDELIVFKQLDSRTGVAQVCPHTSFYDRGAADNTVERRSLETRVMCAYPKDAAA